MFIALVTVIGVLIGSYLGVVADRVPRGEPTSGGRSHCDACGADLRWFELIPVVSWMIQGGRCRRCHVPITVAPLLMEMVTGALFGVMAARWGRHLETIAYVTLTSALVVLSAIDLRTRRLPRRLIYLAAAVDTPLLVAAAIVRHQPHRIANAAIGAGIGLAFFLLLFVVWSGGMGDGDVRLAGLLGMHLGWIGLLHVPIGLFLGFLAGALAGVVALIRGGSRKTTLPFGPFMAVGALVAIVWGRPLIDAWLGH